MTQLYQQGPTWRVLSPGERFTIPPTTKVNAKGNYLWQDPSTGQPKWVPPEGVQHGIVLVEPRICSSCMAGAAGLSPAAAPAPAAQAPAPTPTAPPQGATTWEDVRRAFLERIEGSGKCTTCNLQQPQEEDWLPVIGTALAIGIAALAIAVTTPPSTPAGA